MRMKFRADDEEAFYQAQGELLDRFAAWAERQAPQADPTLVSFALDYKWGYGDGHLGRWTTADLTDLLINWFPRKVSVFAEEVERVVPSLRAFLDWLPRNGCSTRRATVQWRSGRRWSGWRRASWPPWTTRPATVLPSPLSR